MVWNLVQFNYYFHFAESMYDGLVRDRLHKKIKELRESEDPTKLNDIYKCREEKTRHVVEINDVDLLLFFRVYDNKHENPALRNCIELIQLLPKSNFE